MGLLNGVDRVYYEGEDLGGYQFTSLDDIISQFQIAYVGEDKIISKIKRADVAFHAQRALQELSFDTLKSVKAHEIVLPPTLSMILPRDYVNYTKVSSVDAAGIKHPLYPTKDTSNPFSVKQKGTGAYSFDNSGELVKNHTFDESINGTWEFTPAAPKASNAWTNASQQDANGSFVALYKYDKIGTQSGDTTFPWNDLQAGKLNFESYPAQQFGGTAAGWAREYGAWQKIDVSNLFFIDLEVNGESADQIKDNVDIACDFGELRVGLSSVDPEQIAASQGTVAANSLPKSVRLSTGSGAGNFSIHIAENYDLGYLEWNDGSQSWKHLRDVDVSEYDYIWVWVQSFSPWTSHSITPNNWLPDNPEPGATAGVPNSSVFGNSGSVNRVAAVKINSAEPDNMLREANSDRSSTTRNNYNSSTPSENVNDNYEDDTYWPASGGRYGIDPKHAQVNGSFYVDNKMGKINFSSNISGKTVILDYISDSLGTDEEMQVHKFAEEAMYKCIAYAILSTRANTQEYIVQRFKKERFAAMRTAKLRMSNIKIEELTQILRGKSKWIKH